MENKLLFLVGVLALSGVAYADEHHEGSVIYQNPPLTTSEPSYQPQSTLTTSFPAAVLMRLDAIEARLDTIAKFQKDVVAPMHKEMLEKLKELRQ